MGSVIPLDLMIQDPGGQGLRLAGSLSIGTPSIYLPIATISGPAFSVAESTIHPATWFFFPHLI